MATKKKGAIKKSASASKAVKLRVSETPKGAAKKPKDGKRVSNKAKAWAREARKDEKEGRTSKWPD